MTELEQVLEYLRDRLAACELAPDSEYRDGSIAELEEAIEFCEDMTWP